MSAGTGLTAVLWLLAILALIPVSLWLLKRTPLGGAGQGSGLKAVGVLPLSQSQRIVTIEVGHGEERRWLVLGVTPQAISTLHVLSTPPAGPLADSPEPATLPPFAQALRKLTQGAQRRAAPRGDAE
jgi:flagellar protein FliO/FliZ